MSQLRRFLRADDLDELLKVRQGLALSWTDRIRVAWVIWRWRDRQAVANLLFHADLIPAGLRLKAVKRGLRSYHDPYLALAALVGLPSLKADAISDQERFVLTWTVWAMLQQSQSPVVAGRASVTMFSWLTLAEVPTVICLYPVSDPTASHNILTLALARYGDLPRHEYVQRISDCNVSAEARAAFENAYDEYQRQKALGAPSGFMRVPLLCYIPNLGEVAPFPPATPTSRRWRFWPWRATSSKLNPNGQRS